MNIKQLDDFCKLRNYSIVYNRDKIHCGFRCQDYVVDVRKTPERGR